ncbi:MAG: hypothetical protein HYX68_09425 [Planctomycetes bacterium]|nr:hypothetical protein [Planctomycetota bacterium]
MIRRFLLAFAFGLTFTVPAFAQLPWQFQWKKGQVLTYKVKHVTSVVEVVNTTRNQSDSKLDLVNRWEVTDLDVKGIATLKLTLVSMRNEQKRAKGDTVLFDSQNLEKSTPELREQMKKYIGATLAIVRMDGFGRIIDVKQGSRATFEAEPPFLVVFPAAKAEAGQAWRRPFKIVFDPPYGTGEKFDADQRYECKSIKDGKATISLSTSFKTMPDNARERLPLLQKEVQGEIVFDLPTGRLMSARLSIDKTIENHQGKGSSYQFKSQYVRDLVE